MHLSIFSDELHDGDTVRTLDTLVSWGLEYVDFRGGVFGKPIDALSAAELRQLRSLLKERGLRTAALQSSLAKVHLPDAARRADEATKLEGLIRAAEALDCPLVRSFNFWQPGPEQRGALAQQPDQRQLVLDAFGPLAERAHQAGLVLAFENCGQSTAEVHALLDALAIEAWGLAWDPYNEWAGSPERERDEVAYLLKHAARSRMLHVKAHGILPELGETPLPWNRLIATYLASGGTGPVSVETHNRADSPLSHVEASQRCVNATREAWPTDTPSDPREAAKPRMVPVVARDWASNPLRLVVVGLGMGRNRARMIAETTGCQLYGVCDLQEDRARTVGAERDVTWTTTVDTFLTDPQVEAVFVVTETGRHLDVAEQALKAGKHVITTKPMEASLERCNQMIAAADQAERALAVDFSRRYARNLGELKAALDENWFGRVLSVHSHLKIWRDEGYFARNEAWHGTWALDGGGTFSNQCIHHIDELVHCFGLPERVRCLARTQAKPIEAEDYASASWEYADGLIVEISSTTSWRASSWYHRLEVCGSEADYISHSGGPETAATRWWKDGSWSDQAPLPAASTWLNSADNLAAHLRSGAPLACDGRDGARSRQVLDAMYTSARNDGAWTAIDAAGTVLAQGTLV
ncbi:MAG: TIM barrel protein [Planctomycetota bacterium]|jgi:UDP-N-acetyl-2-amino-2-deoxyglucuronate dehydrogenase|nr:TIM barrel protein [Planctomycetota bacterium]